MILVDQLREAGYRVVEARYAEQALELLQHDALDVNAVISDIWDRYEMPGSNDGFGLAKWIRENRPGLDVVLTGTVPRTVDSAKELCEQGPIPKPYDAQVVDNQIRRLLAARQTAKRSD